jgi:hypothetical protein
MVMSEQLRMEALNLLRRMFTCCSSPRNNMLVRSFVMATPIQILPDLVSSIHTRNSLISQTISVTTSVATTQEQTVVIAQDGLNIFFEVHDEFVCTGPRRFASLPTILCRSRADIDRQRLISTNHS